jgi:hypothetical protein
MRIIVKIYQCGTTLASIKVPGVWHHLKWIWLHANALTFGQHLLIFSALRIYPQEVFQ